MDPNHTDEHRARRRAEGAQLLSDVLAAVHHNDPQRALELTTKLLDRYEDSVDAGTALDEATRAFAIGSRGGAVQGLLDAAEVLQRLQDTEKNVQAYAGLQRGATAIVALAKQRSEAFGAELKR